MKRGVQKSENIIDPGAIMTPNFSLLQWLATFELDGQPSVELKNDAYYNLADGYVSARILNQICPQYFTDKWLDGIKPVPPNGSWRLRVSNLKRILQKIHDYASDLQSPQFRPSAITPDVAVIAQNFDPDQISRFIQLIFFCAISCDKQQEYIERMSTLPTQVQEDIKEAIKELLIKNVNEGDIHKFNTSQSSTNSDKLSDVTANSSQRFHLNISHNTSSNSQFETIEEVKQRLNSALTLKEEKAQACHELELKLKQLQLEKDQLISENERLAHDRSSTRISSSPKRLFGSRRSSQVSRDLDFNNSDNDDVDNRLKNLEDEKLQNLALQQNKKLQTEVHRLKEELIKLETERDEFRLKAEVLKDDFNKIASKHDKLQNKAEQAKRLQDELDEQKHISEKVINYESTIENLKRKNNELKRELQDFEEKNVAHIKENVRLKEENSQLANSVNRVEFYKQQLQETQKKLSQETHRAEKSEIELNRLSEKYSAAKQENEKLYETTNQLMRRGVNNASQEIQEPTFSQQSTGIELKERVVRLEYENELLQNKLKSKRESDQSALGALLESANMKCSKLEVENMQSRKRLILLESRLKDVMSSHCGPSTSSSAMRESNSDNMSVLINRVEELQRLLYQKEQDLMESEAKYRKNLNKAKDVIKTLSNNQPINSSLHPSCVSSASSFNSSSLDELNMIKQQLKEREERLIEMERKFYEFKKLKEIHERLIISAFYGMVSYKINDI